MIDLYHIDQFGKVFKYDIDRGAYMFYCTTLQLPINKTRWLKMNNRQVPAH